MLPHRHHLSLVAFGPLVIVKHPDASFDVCAESPTRHSDNGGTLSRLAVDNDAIAFNFGNSGIKPNNTLQLTTLPFFTGTRLVPNVSAAVNGLKAAYRFSEGGAR